MNCPIGFIECKYKNAKVKTCSVCLRQQFNEWLAEHDRQIRAEVIAKVSEEIIKEGNINITHIAKIAEQLKESRNDKRTNI